MALSQNLNKCKKATLKGTIKISSSFYKHVQSEQMFQIDLFFVLFLKDINNEKWVREWVHSIKLSVI